MARSLGYPSRVVMGFAPDIPDGGGAVEVTGHDVTAWVEVAFSRSAHVASRFGRPRALRWGVV